MIKLIIFDLDGTLLNTIGDLANSTNHALKQHGFPTHPTEAYNLFIGNGINKLFERALPEGSKTEENILFIRQAFLEHYSRHNQDLTAPYPDIPVLLKELKANNLLLAVASNKYHEATQKLIAHYFPEISFVAVFGQREGIMPKPDPTIVEDILSIASIDKNETLYVGDSGVDMQTALNSGVKACGVTWGFRSREELKKYHPTHIVNTPLEIADIVKQNRKD